ncbi:MAG: Shedu immune nuclease family protein [Gemmata sp.]
MTKARITQTGPDSAVVEPVVLRPGDLTRMVFKPQIVNNKQDENKPVKGHVLWQKRGKSEAGEEWADEAHTKLSHMTAGSGIKLELSTDELYLLTQAVRGLYGVYWKQGKRLPKTGEEFDLAEYAQAAKALDTLDAAAQLIESAGQDGFVAMLRAVASQKNTLKVIEGLSKLDMADLTEINALAGVGVLRKALAEWTANRDKPDESFWQETLTKYSFVFSQVFSAPVVVFGSKVYVGGKSVQGDGGKEPDFLLKNELTAHLLLVEIKTPATELLAKSPYRPPNVFAATRELAGAVTQVARYKDTFLQNYGNLRLETPEPFRLVDPRCLVVIGNTGELDTEGKRESFEHFRRALRGTEIITFDELFRKVEVLLHLLEGKVAA